MVLAAVSGSVLHLPHACMLSPFAVSHECMHRTGIISRLGTHMVLSQDMERRGTFDEEQMAEARKNTAMSMQMMREAAHSKKPAHLLDK